MHLFNLFVLLLNVVFISTTISLNKTQMRGEGVVDERNEQKAEESVVAILTYGQLTCGGILIETHHQESTSEKIHDSCRIKVVTAASCVVDK
jgi:hypothetical protein